MYPSIVAAQLKETLRDYLETTFSFSDPEFNERFLEFLTSHDGILKGPYLSIKLPFRKGSNKHHSLEISPPFQPFEHQRKSFGRLHSRHGHQPQPTLVVTGTGSGKTECFLYPILDHCYRTRNEPGVKAILLYPMNALATDQARRLAKILWNDERLKGNVTAGLYVGGSGQHQIATEDNLIDDRAILRKSAPNILLTNYKMLDFLLQRPEDKPLWNKNAPETLTYLVLDELHTYDGAQGSDVACLIRRLRSRLRIPLGSLCCVGTSATIGAESNKEAEQPLIEFARKVFGEPNFNDDSIIPEDRLPERDVLEDSDDWHEPNAKDISKMYPEPTESVEEYLARQAALWLQSKSKDLDAIDIGNQLRKNNTLASLLQVLRGRLRPMHAVCDRLSRMSAFFRDLSVEKREVALNSFVSLISYAKARDGDRVVPFLTCHVHFWFRELRRLQQKVSKELEFFWLEKAPKETHVHGLPLAYCRDCGANGVGTVEKEAMGCFISTPSAIGEAFLKERKQARFVILNRLREDGQFPTYLDPQSLHHRYAETPEEGEIPIAVTLASRKTGGGSQTKRFLGECPMCGAEGSLSLLGSRAATLSSVAISLIFNTPFNQDKKLLAFTDSVQDASHRSGFFGARTYRFHLRTQLQKVVQASGGSLGLDDCSKVLLQNAENQGGNALASFWPADLEQNESYLAYRKTGELGPLLDELAQRLSWEICMEYGYSARVGRTLEKTGSSTVYFEPDALEEAAQVLAEDIKEKKLVLARRASKNDVLHFLLVFLHRLRVRGGIHHPLLAAYVNRNGDGFLLNKKKNPLISPFPPGTRQPRFLHSDSSHEVFDVYRGSAPHWYRDWASRALGVDFKDQGIVDVYRQAIRRLVEHGIMKSLPAGKAEAHGIDSGCLTVTDNLSAVQCPQCQQKTNLAIHEAEAWSGRKCGRYRCDGILETTEIRHTYYSRIYRSGHTTRVNSHEHTGLLERNDREAVEEAFKKGGPGDPNLLVCTPTLELGVDVGDLSATMVCSVPPSPANFVQRMGRAGRTTGNAFCLSVAISRPHDLYFYTQPEKMMAGEVRPPSCFLNAPEMLKRQLTAFVLDSWAREEQEKVAIPRHASLVIGAKRSVFPGRAIEYFKQNQDNLIEQFLNLFADQLDDKNATELREFGLSQKVPKWLNDAFDDLKFRRDDLKRKIDKTVKRLQQLETDPESSEDPEAERRDLEDSRRVLMRLREEIQKKYPLNVLTDDGVLPNYAFPEPGVTLRSVVKVRTDGPPAERYETKEYLRAASSAIKEFAPFNRFYADGRKVRIRQIDIGSKSHPLVEKWRFCPDCNHMERVLSSDPPEVCPVCGSSGFCDAGQERYLVPFRRASAFSSPLDTIAVDETDDRQPQSYHTINLVSVTKENQRGAFAIEAEGFGYELLHEVTLREVNFGLTATNQGDFHVAGHKVNEDGFVVCAECGACEEKDHRKQLRIDHAAYCKHRRGKFKEEKLPIMLYREVTSEAIRILLPSITHQLEQARASFKAALVLGLRCYFGGDPGHLIIREVSEPSGQGDGQRRHYLVLYDAVPGGTGYLSDLSKDQNLLKVLDQAQSELLRCSCNLDEDADGCYRCLYAYQASRELPNISRRKALEIISPLLKARDQLKPKGTLSQVSRESLLESELEKMFLEALRKHCLETRGYEWEESSHGGTCYNLTLEKTKWRLELQKTLGKADGVSVGTKPDFLLTNIAGALDAPTVAVYCDGFSYHVCPDRDESRMADDILKRKAIVGSKKHLVWSLTYGDVVRFAEGEVGKGFTAFSHLKARNIQKFVGKQEPGIPIELHQRNAVTQLFYLLDQPALEEWKNYSDALLCAAAVQTPFLSSEQLIQSEDLVSSGTLPVKLQGQLKRPEELLGHVHSERGFCSIAVHPSKLVPQRDLSHSRSYLCLADDRETRASENFYFSWQKFLSTWNLLQFQDDLQVFCTGDEASRPGARTKVESIAEKVDEISAELPEEFEFLDPSCQPLITRLLEEKLPLPEVGKDVASDGRVIGEAELLWEAQKLVVLLDEEEAGDFVAGGWKALLPENIDNVVEVLRHG